MAKKAQNSDEKNFLQAQVKFYDLQIARQIKDADIYYLKTLTLIKLSKKNEALNCLNQAIELNPERAIYYAYKALLHGEVENYQQAKKMLEKASNTKLSTSVDDKKAQNIMLEVTEKIPKYHEDLVVHEQQEIKNRLAILEEKNEKLQAIVDEVKALVSSYMESDAVELVKANTEDEEYYS